MKKILVPITVLALNRLEYFEKVMGLLGEHSADLNKTGHFNEVRINPSTIIKHSEIISVQLFPKSPEEWKKYNDGAREKKKLWFKENLLDSGLVEVLDSYVLEIEVPETVPAE